MLLTKILLAGRESLKNKGINSYQIDALLLLCHSLSFTKEQVIFNPNFELNQTQEKQFLALLQRRANHEPISHIIGRREFYGHNFIVSSKVLDPRPDSETIIMAIEQLIPDQNSCLNILELGVGSGCLLLTILKHFGQACGVAVDIDDNALQIAQKNASWLEVEERVKFIQSDWFKNLPNQQKFQLIISNPPYIKTADIELLSKEVKNFEPRTALDGGADGLMCYRQIASEVSSFLSHNGMLVLEIGQNQHDEVIEIFSGNNLEFVAAKKDLSGIIRCLVFSKKF